MTEDRPHTVTAGKYAGLDGLRRLYTALRECNNRASQDYYLDLILAHPDYDPRPGARAR